MSCDTQSKSVGETTCGYGECTEHLTEHDLNYDVKLTERYRHRPLLCRLSIHPHSKGGTTWRRHTCVRCGHMWYRQPNYI